jgi:hypothetical protein
MATAARAADDVSVVWQAQPRQAAFISCPVFEVFFGGARGGGKTDAVLGDFLEHSDTYGENAIGLMVRRTRTELVETIERSKVIYGALGWQYHEQASMWRSPAGARLRFAYLERDDDANKYQGHSYTRVYVEEIGNFPSDRPILKLMATLRSGAGVPVGFRATGNPGGPGHAWVRDRYVDAHPGGWRVFTDPLTGLERVFIPSRVEDNRYLGKDYVATLRASGSKELVRAWLEGDWSVIQGAFFDAWSQDMVVAPFAVPGDWLRFRSADWGFASPFSVGWWAVAGEDHGRIPRGALVRYREWYGSEKPNIGIRLTAEQVAHEIVRKEAEEKIGYGVLDPSAFKNDGGPPIGETINRILLAAGHSPFRPADNTRLAKGQGGAMGGWDQMRNRMVGIDGRPMIYFFHTCAASIRTIPPLVHDPDRAEDIMDGQEDHAADEVRYACMSRPWVPVKVAPPQDKSELKIEAVPGGGYRTNMSVMEIVQARMRKKKLRGY